MKAMIASPLDHFHCPPSLSRLTFLKYINTRVVFVASGNVTHAFITSMCRMALSFWIEPCELFEGEGSCFFRGFQNTWCHFGAFKARGFF